MGNFKKALSLGTLRKVKSHDHTIVSRSAMEKINSKRVSWIQSKQIDFLIQNRLFGKFCKCILKEVLIASAETSYFLQKFTILRKEQTCIILHVQTERRRDSIRCRDQQGDNNLYRGPWFEWRASCIKGLAITSVISETNSWSWFTHIKTNDQRFCTLLAKKWF